MLVSLFVHRVSSVCSIDGTTTNSVWRVTGVKSSSFVVSDCWFALFSGWGNGGAISLDTSGSNVDSIIQDSTFSDCSCFTRGGALCIWIASGTTTILRCCSYQCNSAGFANFCESASGNHQKNEINFLSACYTTYTSYTVMFGRGNQAGKNINSSKNSVTGSHSGIHFCYYQSAALSYSTFYSNTAGGIGCIFIGQSTASSQVSYTNLVMNSQSGSGYGLFRTSETACTVTNSLFAKNYNCVFYYEGGSLSVSYSVMGDNPSSYGSAAFSNNQYVDNVNTYLSNNHYTSKFCHPNFALPTVTATIKKTPDATITRTIQMTKENTLIETENPTFCDTPKETIENTPCFTPIQSPEFTALSSPHQTPMRTYVENPTPHQSLFPIHTPYDTHPLEQTPFNTHFPDQTPFNTHFPEQTPHQSLFPIHTPYNTNINNSKDITPENDQSSSFLSLSTITYAGIIVLFIGVVIYCISNKISSGSSSASNDSPINYKSPYMF